jgi:hypothetical protein
MAREKLMVLLKDRLSFHFGTQQYKIIGMISHLGPVGVADGIL